MSHVVATGAGKAMMERRNDPTHEYILGLTRKKRPRVLFVGTATGDDAAYIVSFYSTYDSDPSSASPRLKYGIHCSAMFHSRSELDTSALVW